MDVDELTEAVKSRVREGTRTDTSDDRIEEIVETTAEVILEWGVEVDDGGKKSDDYD